MGTQLCVTCVVTMQICYFKKTKFTLTSLTPTGQTYLELIDTSAGQSYLKAESVISELL